MADDGAKRASGPLDDTHLATEPPPPGRDDTLLATTPPPRSSLPSLAPPPDQRYQLGAEIGRGGMGRVVEAFDTHLGRTVALKEVLPKGGNIDRRFQREVRITARLEHASIVPLYDSGLLADGRPFYVMRRVSGRPLDELIARERSLQGRLALLPNVLAAIDAIAHAHRRSVIHRDLKPSNILVGELGETVVIDWGLAKVIGDTDEPAHDSLAPRVPSAADSLRTQVGAVFGTPGFMAPEQARGDELGPSGDVYALGATLYQLLAGRPPLAGASATEVLDSTLRHRIQPIGDACPGAPVELATIIDKALEFEAEDRYANAGELAEDVRRFLTGQLVGAHSYTRRQRIARFARKNRAPLVVAALASVGIALLAWFSVHRIMRERDVATINLADAKAQRARADARSAELRLRADELLLLHARSLVATSPTDAIAVLKQFTGTGRLLDEAKAIARAAAMRGVAYGLPTLPDFTTRLEMSQDGKRVLQYSRQGQLQILDLEARRVLTTYKTPALGWVTWVAGDRLVLITMPTQPAMLYDPQTGKADVIATEEVIQSVARNPRGDHVALVDKTGRLMLLDPVTRAVRAVPSGTITDRVQVADDGSWFAVVEKVGTGNRVVIIDRDGRELAQRTGDSLVMAASSDGKLALAMADGVFEVRPGDAKPTFAKLPLEPNARAFIHQLLYRGELLYMLSHQSLQSWNGTRIRREQGLGHGAMLGVTVNKEFIVVTSGDGLIYVIGDELTHQLRLTSKPSGLVRIAAVPGGTKLVATAGDAVIAWDLAHVLPEMHQRTIRGVFATETRVVQPAGIMPHWTWWDLARGTQERFAMVALPGLPYGTDVSEGRVMVVLFDEKTKLSRAVIASADGKRESSIEGVSQRLIRLVEGNAVIYSPGRGRLLGKVGDEEARELVSLDSDLRALAPAGSLAYVALSERGELVRGRFDGSGFERVRLDGATASSFVAIAPDGAVWIGDGARLLRWAADVREVAKFPSPIKSLDAGPGGVCVTLDTDELMFISGTGAEAPRRLVVGVDAWIAGTLERVASVNGANEIEVIELPSLATWTLPNLYSALPRFMMSPSGRTFLQNIGGITALRRIPQPASDFSGWLESLTNGRHEDNHVRWPWQ